MSELSGMQSLLLLGLAGLAFLYVFLFRVWLTVAVGADLLFASALAACIASIAVPSVFALGAGQVVGASPLPPVLTSADARLDALEALPGEIVAKALARIGYSPEADEVAAAVRAKPAPGRIESSVRPAVESLIAEILRFGTFVGSSFLLLVSLALRSATTTTRQLRAIGLRLDALETDAAQPKALTSP